MLTGKYGSTNSVKQDHNVEKTSLVRKYAVKVTLLGSLC